VFDDDAAALTVRIISARPLVYTDTVDPDEDRPLHVRAASAIAAWDDELWIVQDDTGFLARVRGDTVTSLALPRGPSGRRRFEVQLGNKLDKLDLESCVIVGDELWAFGSGTIAMREHVVHVTRAGDVRITHAHQLYAQLRDALGGAINIEGVALVGDDFWFFHRGNTSAIDRPTIVRTDRNWQVRGIEPVELGAIDGVRFGFTDACAIEGGVAFLASAEASANAIDDGRVLGNLIGIYERDHVCTAPLIVDGKPEGLAVRGNGHAWITVDPDDPEIPTTLYGAMIKRSK
jgi:hypothetical protein